MWCKEASNRAGHNIQQKAGPEGSPLARQRGVQGLRVGQRVACICRLQRVAAETRIAGKRVRPFGLWHSGGKHTGVDQPLLARRRATACHEPRGACKLLQAPHRTAACGHTAPTWPPPGRAGRVPPCPPPHPPGAAVRLQHGSMVCLEGWTWPAVVVHLCKTDHHMLRRQVVQNSTTAAMQRTKHAPDSCCEKLVGSGERRAGCCSGMESPSLPAVAAYLQVRDETGMVAVVR